MGELVGAGRREGDQHREAGPEDGGRDADRIGRGRRGGAAALELAGSGLGLARQVAVTRIGGRDAEQGGGAEGGRQRGAIAAGPRGGEPTGRRLESAAGGGGARGCVGVGVRGGEGFRARSGGLLD